MQRGCPASSWYLPAGHFSQFASPAAANVPALQSPQRPGDDTFEVLPSGQLMQLVVWPDGKTVLKRPSLHGAQKLALAPPRPLRALPAVPDSRPAGHGEHSASFSLVAHVVLENLPRGHPAGGAPVTLWHRVFPDVSELGWNLPGGQHLHDVGALPASPL